MKTYLSSQTAYFFIFYLLFNALFPDSCPASTKTEQKFTLLFSNNVAGEYEPCG